MIEFYAGLFHAEFVAGVKFNDLATCLRRLFNRLHDGKFAERPCLATDRESAGQTISGDGCGQDDSAGQREAAGQGKQVGKVEFHNDRAVGLTWCRRIISNRPYYASKLLR